jgi:glutamyl-tRNA synthetase
LFNFLFARKHGGRFLLRIEDTDEARSSPEMTGNILASLRWLGISWEGEPVLQSSRREEHIRVCKTLLEQGLAYPCFCDPAALRERREAATPEGADTKYPRTCLRLSPGEVEAKMRRGEPYAVRFRIPDGGTTVRDRIRGNVTVSHSEIDDFVILRSDGTPVYQVAVVVDDHGMGITHVVRGEDHLSNTPKQVLLYQAMRWPVPEFAHVPMILGPDKKRLSKRHGAASVEEYRKRGILAEALRNFLALLGWSPGNDREIMSIEEMAEAFSLEAVSKKSAVFDEQKLAWMNAQYIARLPDDALVERVLPFLPPGVADPSDPAGKRLMLGFVRLMRPRVQTLSDFHGHGAYFFNDPDGYEPRDVLKHWPDRSVADLLDDVAVDLENAAEWVAPAIEAAVRGFADRKSLKAGQVIHPVRVALAGSGASPGLFELMEVLGPGTVVRRLRAASAWIFKHLSAG